MEPLLCIGSWTRPNLYGGNLIGGIFVCFRSGTFEGSEHTFGLCAVDASFTYQFVFDFRFDD